MTDQEIKNLQEKLGTEYSVKRLNGAITVELVDIWEGVEFVQSNWSKTIYPVSQIINFKPCNEEYTPSTESNYIEQLKAKAKELYGEIKNGDRFDCYMLDPSFTDHELAIVTRENDDFDYIKKWDRLYKSGVTIYQQGKWAKKLVKPETVKIIGYDFTDFHKGNLSIQLNKAVKITDPNHFIDHLENAINGYLKSEPK